MDKRTCSIDGCGKPVLARGWCATHYMRWRTTGDVGSAELLRKPLGSVTCSVEDCLDAAESRGWCAKHYKRWQAHGDPEATLHTETCSVEGCGRKHSSRGLCATHNARRKAGTPLDAPLQVNNKGAACSIADCEKLAEKCGERIGRELNIPVYLYDHAAKRPERKDLASVRKGQFEGL